MYIVIATSLIALLLTYYESIGRLRGGMKWGFVIITVICAIHYDYGNDYMSYYNVYKEVESTDFNFSTIMQGYVYRDPGWALLNYLFKPLGGFFVLVAVLNIIQNVIIYRFIKREVAKEWWPISVFIYLFTTSFYLMSFSMMRQWFVVCIFMSMWPYIKKRNWWIPLLVLYLCHFIHGSSIVLIPFAFWGFLPIKNSKLYTLIFAGFVIALWISGTWVNTLIEQTVSLTETESFVERYEQSDTINGSFGIGAFLKFLPLLLGLFYLFNEEGKDLSQKQLVALSIIGFAIAPLNQLLPAIGRMGLFFSFFQVATFPVIYGRIKNVPLRLVFISIYVLLIVYDYLLFFKRGVFADHYRYFHTIFSVL